MIIYEYTYDLELKGYRLTLAPKVYFSYLRAGHDWYDLHGEDDV